MTYAEVLKGLVEVRGHAPAVAGPGVVSRLLWAAGHERATLYQMELGYPCAVALGLALAAPSEDVVALEGDGSLLAGLSTLTTIARYAPPNLIVLAFDNGVYGTVGSGTTTTATRHGTDLVAVARACGWDSDRALRVSDASASRAALRRAFAEPGPWLIAATVEGGTLADARDVGQIPYDIVEAAIMFRRDMIERGYA